MDLLCLLPLPISFGALWVARAYRLEANLAYRDADRLLDEVIANLDNADWLIEQVRGDIDRHGPEGER